MEVTLYSTGCPKCKVLEQKLNENKLKYKVVSSVEEMLSKGFTNVPMIEIVDDKINKTMGFADAFKWLNERTN